MRLTTHFTLEEFLISGGHRQELPEEGASREEQ